MRLSYSWDLKTWTNCKVGSRNANLAAQVGRQQQQQQQKAVEKQEPETNPLRLLKSQK